MIYKDFFIEFIERKGAEKLSYYGCYCYCLKPLNDDWKWAAIAWRMEDYIRVGGNAGAIVATTPMIAYDLIKFWIDLLLLRESRENDKIRLYRTSGESLREKRQKRYRRAALK